VLLLEADAGGEPRGAIIVEVQLGVDTDKARPWLLGRRDP
jgi:hypothetical protein